VVIAIIGILVALLLPAVQAAREAARFAQCKNNVKQMAIGWLNHESTHSIYPSGGWGPGWSGDADCGTGPMQPGGWIYQVLPYVEQQPLHDLGAGMQNELLQKLIANGHRYVTPVPMFNCPSRRPSQMFKVGCCIPQNNIFNVPGGAPSGQARSDYAANLGDVHWGYMIGQVPKVYILDGCWDYIKLPLNPGEFLFSIDPEIFTGVNYSGSKLNSKNVTDGTSNTYMLGEKHVDPLKYYEGHEWGDDWGMYTGQQDDVSRMCYYDPDEDPANRTTPIQDTPGTGNSYPESQQFGSAHSSGMNMAFCDGSVHIISYDIDWFLHSILSNRHDGKVVDLSAL